MIKLLVLLMVSKAVFSAETVPFIYYKQKHYPQLLAQVKQKKGAEAEAMGIYEDMREEKNSKKTEVAEVPVEKIESILKTWRTNLCEVNKQGEFKFWIKLDASGKVFGIGTTGESGVEVLIKCI